MNPILKYIGKVISRLHAMRFYAKRLANSFFISLLTKFGLVIRKVEISLHTLKELQEIKRFIFIF